MSSARTIRISTSRGRISRDRIGLAGASWPGAGLGGILGPCPRPAAVRPGPGCLRVAHALPRPAQPAGAGPDIGGQRGRPGRLRRRPRRSLPDRFRDRGGGRPRHGPGDGLRRRAGKRLLAGRHRARHDIAGQHPARPATTASSTARTSTARTRITVHSAAANRAARPSGAGRAAPGGIAARTGRARHGDPGQGAPRRPQAVPPRAAGRPRAPLPGRPRAVRAGIGGRAGRGVRRLGGEAVALAGDKRSGIPKPVQEPGHSHRAELPGTAGVLLDQLARAGHEGAPVLGTEAAARSNGHAIDVVADQLLLRGVHSPIIPRLSLLVESARAKNQANGRESFRPARRNGRRRPRR
jgi:hypothetical protein